VSVGIVDPNPVTVRVLEINLPNPVCPDGEIPRLVGKADVCHAVLLQASEDRLEVAGGERNGRAELRGALFFGIAADQVKRSEAVDCEPLETTFADSMGCFVEAGNIRGEASSGCACQSSWGLRVQAMPVDLPQRKKPARAVATLPTSLVGRSLN
jgi:hypothetical protein